MEWHVLLIGGPSGVGKTELAHALARRLDVTVSDADDLYAAVRQVTTAESHPVLHSAWDQTVSPERTVQRHLAVCRELAPAIEAVIGCHLDNGPPVIIEGDYVLPQTATRDGYAGISAAGRVRAVFLTDDEPALAANLLRREPDVGPQDSRARIGHLLGQELARQCATRRLPMLLARPWGDLADRTLAAIGEWRGRPLTP